MIWIEVIIYLCIISMALQILLVFTTGMTQYLCHSMTHEAISAGGIFCKSNNISLVINLILAALISLINVFLSALPY